MMGLRWREVYVWGGTQRAFPSSLENRPHHVALARFGGRGGVSRESDGTRAYRYREHMLRGRT